ncbi:phosphoribosylamine--glycine ligase [Bifidobacterium bifidum LMG 13195]|uniref:phosphoribosylamine--glycine ligase n=1 Tax=Bifidobacterium bifidum LMG 13195 TaxID=1207542 RepID=A0A286TAT7_BIFBI|nr:phosphoribosylamine--glycine ligase [Bifidobacterium bifidum LMG 13195]
MGQKVLVIGSGAREHAIAHALLRGDSVSEVTVASGNPGMELDGIRTTQINESNHAAFISFMQHNQYDWAFVGPEVPLIEGLVDDFAAAGIKAFGPNKAAAQIEGSKDFAKQLMARHNIPTAQYRTFDNLEDSVAYVREHGAPIVVKADGLAAGKGVTVAMDVDTAITALDDIFIDHRFGKAGAKVVIEDFLEGQEFSLMSFVRGTEFWPMPISQDHKRAYDNDEGPNTGGMGAYSPVPQIGQDVIDTAIDTIVRPTVEAMAAEGTPFTGILYAGLIATADAPRSSNSTPASATPKPKSSSPSSPAISEQPSAPSSTAAPPPSPGTATMPPSASSSPPTATPSTSSRVPKSPPSPSTTPPTSTTPASPTATKASSPPPDASSSSKPPPPTSSPPKTRSTQSSTSWTRRECFTATTSVPKR